MPSTSPRAIEFVAKHYRGARWPQPVRMKTVGDVSTLSGVSVRTFHHYDELGLLSPSERSEASNRLYASADLERPQEIFVWRALGVPLAG